MTGASYAFKASMAGFLVLSQDIDVTQSQPYDISLALRAPAPILLRVRVSSKENGGAAIANARVRLVGGEDTSGGSSSSSGGGGGSSSGSSSSAPSSPSSQTPSSFSVPTMATSSRATRLAVGTAGNNDPMPLDHEPSSSAASDILDSSDTNMVDDNDGKGMDMGVIRNLGTTVLL